MKIYTRNYAQVMSVDSHKKLSPSQKTFKKKTAHTQRNEATSSTVILKNTGTTMLQHQSNEKQSINSQKSVCKRSASNLGSAKTCISLLGPNGRVGSKQLNTRSCSTGKAARKILPRKSKAGSCEGGAGNAEQIACWTPDAQTFPARTMFRLWHGNS